MGSGCAVVMVVVGPAVVVGVVDWGEGMVEERRSMYLLHFKVVDRWNV